MPAEQQSSQRTEAENPGISTQDAITEIGDYLETTGDADFDDDDEERAESGEPGDEDPEEGLAEDEAAAGEEEGEEDDEEEGGEPIESIKVLVDGEERDVDLGELMQEVGHVVQTANGEETVEYNELVSGYMKGADYTRKTQEIAEVKREMEPYYNLVLYAQHDPMFVQHLEGYFSGAAMTNGDPDITMSFEALQELMTEDPERARDVLQKQKDFKVRMDQQAQTTQRIEAERMAHLQQVNAMEQQKAREIIPDYDEIGPVVRECLAASGFTDQEVSQMIDHRYAVVAAMAARWWSSQANGQAPTPVVKSRRKVKQAPPNAAPAGTGKRTPMKAKKARANLKRARQSGRIEDWTSVIADRLT